MKNMSEQSELINDRPLPSRKEFHKRKTEQIRKGNAVEPESSSEEKKKNRLPLAQSLLVIFLLLVVFILTYNYWFPRVTDPLKGNDDVQKVKIES
ncbi:hypothetical protein M1K46_10350 [Fictibacillus sp. WQ 8-8]|uniref:hypothetical protein n=1 Tax=Fictibacillus sp. WQ 8-8 TaxID=2938788 RepID=UPI002109E182|nr:hypothetical protein [Fictibacillus sp. WQ 8-8]MCQ6266063.1 hypothetical protein [Fictibacillus sp. WQ 8-8]